MRLVIVSGARPNLPKVAALVRAAHQRADCSPTVVHTGQHGDPAMYANILSDLGMEPAYSFLDTQTSAAAVDFVAAARHSFAVLVQNMRPDVVVVVGDVNSTLACALGAADVGVPLAHVEAGLRSFDLSMPEERNRIAVDRLSQWHFATEPAAMNNLAAEGLSECRRYLVGNTMIDSLLANRESAVARQAWRFFGLRDREYLLATLHRPAMVDDEERLVRTLETLVELPGALPILFPIHPRTLSRMQQSKRASAIVTGGRVVATPPIGYLDFLSLQIGARIVLTDSGGVQEETTALDVPCLTLRDSTERPVTIELGSNQLVGCEPAAITAAVALALAAPKRRLRMPDLWDGRASSRVMSILSGQFGGQDSNRNTAELPRLDG